MSEQKVKSVSSQPPRGDDRDYAATTVTTSLTSLVGGGVVTEDMARIAFYVINNDGSTAFNAFDIVGYTTDDDSHILLSTAADWTTPNAPIVFATGSPVTLAAGADELFTLDCLGYYKIDVRASVASGTVSADCSWSGK